MSNSIFPSPFRGLAYTVTKTPEFSTIVQKSPAFVDLRIAQSQNPAWSYQLIYEVLFADVARSTGAFAPYSDLQELMGFYLARQGMFDDFLLNDVDDNTVTNQAMQLVSDATNPISAAVVGSSAGTGFVTGDYVSVVGGGGTGGVLQVSLAISGAISTLAIVNGGSGYTTTTGAALVALTGAGAGSPTANITAVTLYYTPLQRNMGGQFLEDVTDLNPLNGSGLVVKANGVTQTAGTCGGGGTTFELHGPGLAIPGASFGGMYLKWCAQPTPPITASFSFYFRVRFATDKQDFEKFVNNLWTVGGSESKNGAGTLKLTTSRPASV